MRPCVIRRPHISSRLAVLFVRGSALSRRQHGACSEEMARARRTVLHAALASCGIVEAHLSAAGSAAGSVFTTKPYRAQPTAVEQSLPQPLAMMPRRSVHFACPKSNCGGELLPSTERVLRCACGHSIDVAREGYVHLAKRGKANAEQQAESDAVT